MRITCDSNILVRALVAPNGPARAVLDLGTAPPHVVVISNFILAEVRRALSYEHLRQRYPTRDEQVNEFERRLREVADVVELPSSIGAVSADPDDDPIIATAVIGQSDVLCTLDRHLRQPLIQAYCATYSIRVLTDVELLNELRHSIGKQ